MTDFLDKLERALQEFKELFHNTATRDNNFGRGICLSEFSEPVSILEHVFFPYNNLERHIINYFKLAIRQSIFASCIYALTI